MSQIRKFIFNNKALFLFVLLTIVFVCISCFFLFFDSSTNKRHFHNKEKILCCGDYNAYESLDLINFEDVFSYSFFLSNKYNFNTNYYIYNALLSGYKLESAPNDFYKLSPIVRIMNNIGAKYSTEFSKDKDVIKMFVDSCNLLSKNGYFDSIKRFNMDSIFWESSLHYYDKALQYENNPFTTIDIWYFYIMGYVNFKKHDINTDNWILNNDMYIPSFKEIDVNHDTINNTVCCEELMNSEKNFVNIEIIDTLDVKRVWIVGEISELPIQDRILINKIKDGSKFCYELFKLRKRNLGLEHEMLLYALIMSNKYNYTSAYWDVYKYMWLIYNYKQDKKIDDMSNFDNYAKSLAEYHLKKALEYGDKRVPVCLMKR